MCDPLARGNTTPGPADLRDLTDGLCSPRSDSRLIPTRIHDREEKRMPFLPAKLAQRRNPNMLLLDPYAKVPSA